MLNFFKNYFSTLLFIFWAYGFYTHIPFYQNLFIKKFSILNSGIDIYTLSIFQWIILLYIILLIPFYITYTENSKARNILWYIFWKIKRFKYKMSKTEKTSILSWMVKLFFAPLMILWFTDHLILIINNFHLASANFWTIQKNFLLYFNQHLFYNVLIILFFIDVLFFTLWYLIEAPFFKNTIKSVDSTLFGWTVALICYPPFNTYITGVIWWYSKDFPQFQNPFFHIWINTLLLILLGIYASASMALWLKASNLTNRWIITRWAYKYVRHPAYISKNIVWWIWALPLLIGNILNHDIKNTLIVLVWLIWWSFIYYLRAITEERHLSADPEYRIYQTKVKYKFIPKIY